MTAFLDVNSDQFTIIVHSELVVCDTTSFLVANTEIRECWELLTTRRKRIWVVRLSILYIVRSQSLNLYSVLP